MKQSGVALDAHLPLNSGLHKSEPANAGESSGLNRHQLEALAKGGYDVPEGQTASVAGVDADAVGGNVHKSEPINAGEAAGLNRHQREANAKKDAHGF